MEPDLTQCQCAKVELTLMEEKNGIFISYVQLLGKILLPMVVQLHLTYRSNEMVPEGSGGREEVDCYTKLLKKY